MTEQDRSDALPEEPGATTRAWRSRLTWGRRAVGLLVFVAVLEYLVLPQIAGTRAALRTLASIQPAWVLLGVLLEALSLMSYSMFTRSVLPDERPAFWWLLRTDITGLGVSHVVPGGTATASALRYQLLREGGVRAEAAIVGATVQAVGAPLMLGVLLLAGLLTSLPFVGFDLGYVTAALVDVIIIGCAVTLVVLLSRGGQRVTDRIRRGLDRLPRRYRARAKSGWDKAAGQFLQLLADPRSLGWSALWALGNSLLDAASLWVFLAAFGWHADPFEVLLAYAVANLVAVLPISPGGLGVIEGILIPTLVGFGATSTTAVLGVVSWRLFEFWAPIPLSGLAYLSLRTQSWRDRHELRRAWAQLRHSLHDDSRTGRHRDSGDLRHSG